LEGFWEDVDSASKVQRERAIIEETIKLYTSLSELKEEFEILCEYAAEDTDLISEAVETSLKLEKKIHEAEKKVLLSNEFDSNNAIVMINAGAGGTESCDWASMLFRMLSRWVEFKKFKYQVLDVQDGDSAGIKSATFLVTGPFSYGLLKSESGVHRLVRISPFDSNARRHTSFASVFVTPEVDDDIEIEINDKDLKIDVYRAGGAGGQSVNTTDSAVRITHLPTGLVVTCQNERSQLQNKAQAMKVLKSRLFDLEMEKRKQESDAREAEKKEIGWGAQIRSYVLHPYKMVKDHRTNFESSNPDKILDGDLDQFMDNYLRWSVLSDEPQT
jgi:peptide chain release factor 2